MLHEVSKMPIRSKNEDTEQLARMVAPRAGASLMEAVRTGMPWREELNEIALACAGRPVVCDCSEEEILGYDERGLPAR
jgi:antitoxin VapB